MSEPDLTRDEKITKILEFNGVHEEHHDYLREHLELLADEIIERQYVHCLIMMETSSGDPEPDVV
jgi:hypothetical protein